MDFLDLFLLKTTVAERGQTRRYNEYEFFVSYFKKRSYCRYVQLHIPFLSPQLLQYFNSIPSSHDGGDVMGTRRSGVTQTVTICNCGSLWHTGKLLGWHKKCYSLARNHSILHPAVQIAEIFKFGYCKKVKQYFGTKSHTEITLTHPPHPSHKNKGQEQVTNLRIVHVHLCTLWYDGQTICISQGLRLDPINCKSGRLIYHII